MTTIGSVHVGDIGTAFELRIIDEQGEPVDISPAITKTVILKGPTGAAVVKNGEFLTDGKDGWLTYKTVKDDLNAPKRWQVQGFVKLPSGEWHSLVHAFEVEPNLA